MNLSAKLCSLFLLLSKIVFAQESPLPIGSDYPSAIELTFKAKKGRYGITAAPIGFGKKNEIKACDKLDAFIFEKEHNSAWYTFTAPDNGDLIFEIIPENLKNDYDFMLYKYSDTTFYSQLLKGNILPIMSNLARSGKGGKSTTGLSYLSTQTHISFGLGNSFLKPLVVKKGERFVLVIDNVYPKGNGHTIKLYYLRTILINGNVIDENKKPVQSNISLQDANGAVIEQTTSDKNGNYKLNTKIVDTENYTLIYSNDSSFSNSLQITSGFLSKTNYELNNLKITIPKIKQGHKYILNNIEFQPNSERLVNSSGPMLNNLVEILDKYNRMKIQIEGHVNSPNNPVNSGKEALLSHSRAKSIYAYLLSKGIQKDRMSYIGYGSLYMTYPKANSTNEYKANDRIEIFIISK